MTTMATPSYCFGFMLVERRETLYQGKRQVKLTLAPHENDPSLSKGQLVLFLTPQNLEEIEYSLQADLSSGQRFRIKLEPES